MTGLTARNHSREMNQLQTNGSFKHKAPTRRPTKLTHAHLQQSMAYPMNSKASTKVERIIKAYPRRLKECVKRRGRHVETPLQFDL